MLIPTAVITERPNSDLVVDVIWTGQELDRPSTQGWIFYTHQRKLAERLKNAINAGVVFVNPVVVKDVHGKTYVSAETTQFFHKRHMNNSLKKVGF